VPVGSELNEGLGAVTMNGIVDCLSQR
jgi:hypothetical protein